MAVAALAIEVRLGLVFRVTRNTVDLPRMIEMRRLPRGGQVTITALPFKVIDRLVLGVARETVRKADVIERRGQPRSRRVTAAALPFEVIGRLVFRMARRAIGEAAVIEVGGFPRVRRVTGAALTGEVIVWRVFGVAGHAERKARVIEVRGLPHFGGVTVATLARKVIAGRVNLMALLAIGKILVIETGGFERDIGVTTIARHTDLFKLALMFVFVTTHARCRKALRLATNVTGVAGDLGVFAAERRAMFIAQFRRNGDRARGNLTHTRLIVRAPRSAAHDEEQLADRDVEIRSRFGDGLAQPDHPIEIGIRAAGLLPLR